MKKAMTVGQLMDKLADMNPNLPVWISTGEVQSDIVWLAEYHDSVELIHQVDVDSFVPPMLDDDLEVF